jgi:serine/threonine protein kinase/tetratricopeptide (TPR) repeat protein
MDRDRWKTVNEIFHAALELPASERREFVCTASQGDSDLQSEVDRMLRADQQAGSYLESPLLPGETIADPETSPSPFKPGDVLKGRFRIVRQVGEGGMGHVFEAYDTELKVRVALKAIRSEIATNPTALEFFRREVRTARTITHPNVCRTFDLDRGRLNETTGIPREFFFLTMEFLEGETLAARLRRAGPLDPKEALVIAYQIASGLDAAHAAGIVHRDIKPANIMLAVTPNGSGPQTRAVITDFGLARQDPLHSSVAASAFSHGGAVGTLAYMAPEQLEPRSPVSAGTDVYAFGLVLFEMVTGARAFPSANLLSGIAQRLAGPPPSPRALVPQLPQVWETVIQCCLRLAPEDRFQAAGQVVEALGGTTPTIPAVSRPTVPVHSGPPVRTVWNRRRRFLVAAVILLAVVALSVVGFRLYRSRADSKVTPGALVYLTPVKNETGERSLDNITELLQAGLSQSAQINLLDQSRVGDTLQLMTKAPDTPIDPPIAREIAMRTGAVRVVFATVTGSAGSYRLNIDIQQPDGGSPMRYRDDWTESFPWKTSGFTTNSAIPPELLNAVRNANDWIRFEVGESKNDIARLDVPPEDVTTRSWTALSDYSEAERLARDNQFDGAAALLANAIREDQQFALAYGRLGDILLSLHRDAEGYHFYDMALAAAQQDRLTRKEEDRIRGMRAEDTADYQLAIDAFHDFSVYYKNDYLGWVYPTVPLRMLGRDQEAIANLRRAIGLDPGRAFAPFALSQELMITGSFEEVPHWISHLNGHAYPGAASEIKVILLLMNHKYDEAADALRSSNGLGWPDQINATLRKQARLVAERGNFREAIELLNRAIAADDSQSNPDQHAATILDKSYLEYKLNDFRGCVEDARSGFALSSSPEILLAAETVLGNAFAVAPSTFAPAIRQGLEDIGKRIPSENYGNISVVLKLRTRGEILLARGDSAAAVESFRDASRKDAPANSREYLGRGLLALARRERDPEIKKTLFIEAAGTFSVDSKSPALVWCNWLGFPPGFFADQLESYLKVSRLLRRSDTLTSRTRDELASIRAGSAVLHQFSAVQTTTNPTKN